MNGGSRRVGIGGCIGVLMLATGCLPGSGPLSMWVVSELHRLEPDSRPLAESEIYFAQRGLIRLTAAINETVAFQVGLRSEGAPAGPFAVRVTELTSTRDTAAARPVASLYRAHDVRVEHYASWYPGHAGRPATPAAFADILVPWDAPRGGGPVTLDGTRNEIIWVDLRVPATCEPGSYTGRLEVARAGTQAVVASAEIRLRVLPVAIPSERSLACICRVDPRDLLAAHLRWPRDEAEQTRLLPNEPAHRAAVQLVNETMRLLHEHRATPVLWAAFPKFQLIGDRRVQVDWTPYDALVVGWLDGSAFSDRVGLARWPVPASQVYPNAEQNGGFDSPRYARVLAAYLAECRRHFEERGWLDKAFVRIAPPEPLTAPAIERARRVGAILRQSETGLPLVVHLPPRSLAALGWYHAPAVELPDVGVWAAPAMWFEPESMARERALGRQTWLVPDRPPYSGALAVEAPPVDALMLSWQAYRYDAGALWIEDAADCAAATAADGKTRTDGRRGLLYAGAPYGLLDRPVPSIRLKRLRRGLQDYELLRLLERNGQQLLARKIAEQIVPWAMTDACLDHLLSCREAGWPDDPAIPWLARELLLTELVRTLEPTGVEPAEQDTDLTRWGRVLDQADRVRPEVRGVRLTEDGQRLRAQTLVAVTNRTSRRITGQWRLAPAPMGWQSVRDVFADVPPGDRRRATLEIELAALAYNTDGVYPFNLIFETDAFRPYTVPARLAVAGCPYVEEPPVIDGDLSDWIVATNNAAGDFRLCWARGAVDGPAAQDTPTLPTHAFFCMDRERFYVGVRCALREGERPLWRADNVVPVDGATPWGQDVVEVLIDPRNALEGTPADLYILQIKPSGLLVARKGCRTEPPMGASEEWRCGAQVAVTVGRDAWTVEVGLPLASLDSPHQPGAGASDRASTSRIWGCNVTRLDARRGEYSSWSGARDNCYAPQWLGNLVLLVP